MQADTANGPITVFSLQGIEVGHGWGEVKFGRPNGDYRPPSIGSVTRMRWLDTLPQAADSQVYRITFYGGPTFHGVFEGGSPDAASDHAAFTPTNRPHDQS